MPWTAGAFLVGAMAIAGLPPLNGFASEWLTLQALLHVAAYGQVGDGIAGAVALAALAATAALAALLLRQGRRPRAARAAADASRPRRRRRRRCRCARRSLLLAGACVVLGLAPGLLFGPLVGLAPWPAARADPAGLELPGTGLAADDRDRGRRSSRSTGALALLRGNAKRGSGADLGLAASSSRAGASLDERRLHQAAAARARDGAAPAAGDHGSQRGRRRAGGLLLRPRPAPDRGTPLPSRWLVSLLAAAAQARRLQSGSLGTYVGYLIGLVLALLAAARFGWIG